MNFALRSAAIMSTAIAIAFSSGQVKQEGKTAAKYQNQTDVLSKYSLEQLNSILTNRGNKSVYSEEPSEVKNIPTSAIADNINARQKTVYGNDRRKDYFEIQDPNVLKASNSVAAIVRSDYFDISSNGSMQLSSSCPTLGTQYNLCSKESYYSQPVPGVCTAFVVAPDVVATAGHCIEWLGASRIVFGFYAEKNSGQVQVHTSIDASQVYRPMRVLVQKRDENGADYALVRVDRPIIGHPPLQLHTDGDVAEGTIVYVLGHPSGLPLKLADSAIVSKVVPNGYFLSNLDTFGGNSGSPVFNAGNDVVEGILVRGGTDYRNEGTCATAFTCPIMPNGTRDCSGESATLMSQLATSLETISADVQKSAPAQKAFESTFRSGPRLSGFGAGFSPIYELVSDPAPKGFKIAGFKYSLTGDRGCNAWSTCAANIVGDRVVFRFSLQGHSEWFPPRQATSEGVLIVTYVPSYYI